MTKEATSNKVIRKRATPKETISTLLLYFLATLLTLAPVSQYGANTLDCKLSDDFITINMQ